MVERERETGENWSESEGSKSKMAEGKFNPFSCCGEHALGTQT